MLFVDAAHEGSCRGQDLVDEDEDGLFGGQLDALSDHVDELAYGKICGYEVLLLINSSDVGLLDLFADDLGRESSRGQYERASTQAAQMMNEGHQAMFRGCGVEAGSTTYRDAVRVFLTDALGLSLALLKGVLVLELASHFDWRWGLEDGRCGY